jgi:hypothetical protein
MYIPQGIYKIYKMYLVKLHSYTIAKIPVQTINVTSKSQMDAILAYLYLHSTNSEYLLQLCKAHDGRSIEPILEDFKSRIVYRFVEYDLINKSNMSTISESMKSIMEEGPRKCGSIDPTLRYVYVSNPKERRDASLYISTESPVDFAIEWTRIEALVGDPLELMY